MFVSSRVENGTVHGTGEGRLLRDGRTDRQTTENTRTFNLTELSTQVISYTVLVINFSFITTNWKMKIRHILTRHVVIKPKYIFLLKPYIMFVPLARVTTTCKWVYVINNLNFSMFCATIRILYLYTILRFVFKDDLCLYVKMLNLALCHDIT